MRCYSEVVKITISSWRCTLRLDDGHYHRCGQIIGCYYAGMTQFNYRSLAHQGRNASTLRRIISRKLARISWFGIVVTTMYSTHAQADFQYTYVDAAYVFGEFEFANSEVNLKGYELIAQFEVSTSIVVGVKYSSLSGDETVITEGGVSTLEYDGSGPEAYTIFHSPIGARTDFLFGASIDMTDYEALVRDGETAIRKNDDTKLILAGFRHNLNGLELQARWSYNLDAEDDEDEWSYTLGLLSGEPAGLQLGFQLSRKTEGDLMSVSVRQSYR